MRSIFGWSLPPGVSHSDIDPPSGPCEICGQNVDADECICPECPECGAYGDPDCYEKHWLVRTEEQINLLANAEKEWEERSRAEEEYFDRLYRERPEEY